VVEWLRILVAHPLLHVILLLRDGGHPAMLKAIAEIAFLSHLESPGETVYHPSLVIAQRPRLATVQVLFAFQIQGQRKSRHGSEAPEVNLSMLHGHHRESEHRVEGYGVTRRVSRPMIWEEPLVLTTK
jgi:hypothetical protein